MSDDKTADDLELLARLRRQLPEVELEVRRCEAMLQSAQSNVEYVRDGINEVLARVCNALMPPNIPVAGPSSPASPVSGEGEQSSYSKTTGETSSPGYPSQQDGPTIPDGFIPWPPIGTNAFGKTIEGWWRDGETRVWTYGHQLLSAPIQKPDAYRILPTDAAPSPGTGGEAQFIPDQTVTGRDDYPQPQVGSGVPKGYTKLGSGVGCACSQQWQDQYGMRWCCGGDAATYSLPDNQYRNFTNSAEPARNDEGNTPPSDGEASNESSQTQRDIIQVSDQSLDSIGEQSEPYGKDHEADVDDVQAQDGKRETV